MLEIKGITVPAILVKLDPKKSLEENLAEIEDRFSTGMFRDSIVILDYGGMTLSSEDYNSLKSIFCKYGVQLITSKKYKTMDSRQRIDRKSLKIVNKTLRSGQKIEYDGSVVVLGDVNPDAYIVASGNVIVMGSLRGVVHAGAGGDESAVVMALRFSPQQVRIAGYITRSPDNIEEVSYPEMAYIEDERIVIEKIK